MQESATDRANPVWSPDSQTVRHTAMHRFMHACASRFGFETDYQSLYRWSINQPEAFWTAVAEFAGLRFSRSPDQILQHPERMPGARWFEGAQFNYAEQLLSGDGAATVVIFRDERGRRSTLTRDELRSQVAGLAASMRDRGIAPGSRIVAVLPNCSEALVAMLASASIGATFSSCSPDFGAAAIVDRFGQLEPHMLFICDGYQYNGKTMDCRAKAREVIDALTTLTNVVEVPFLAKDPEPGIDSVGELYPNLIQLSQPSQYTQLPFDHPLFILFSSGTTGKPKCIVHGAGGTLLQHLKEHVLHTDLSARDRLFYFTTCGWMMWNWLASALASGATIVLYDGSPFSPDPLAMWQLISDEKVTVFGTSPRFLAATQKSAVDVKAVGALQDLRTILSTGAPLAAESYDFVQDTFDQTVQLCSISGGTDLISCFVLGNPLTPVYRGDIQGPGLGMAVDVVNENGEHLESAMGELVCRQPFPSMPLSFWNDSDNAQYTAAYFSRIAGLWAQGDLAEWTGNGGMRIFGRSDAVLNPGGVRIGSAEVCDPVLALESIADAMAVSQRWKGDERIVLCVVLKAECDLTDNLRDEIGQAIRGATSPRHVPKVIIDVPDLPRTISGKLSELAVRAVIHNENPPNTGALANPESLDAFKNRPELSA